MAKPDCSELSSGRLPAEMAERLRPELQDALDHPLRREILRRLNGSGRGRTAVELASSLRPFRLSQVNYHMLVLDCDGAVIATGNSPTGGRSYVCDLSSEPEVVDVLQATQRCDRDRLRMAEVSSPQESDR